MTRRGFRVTEEITGRYGNLWEIKGVYGRVTGTRC